MCLLRIKKKVMAVIKLLMENIGGLGQCRCRFRRIICVQGDCAKYFVERVASDYTRPAVPGARSRAARRDTTRDARRQINFTESLQVFPLTGRRTFLVLPAISQYRKEAKR